MDERVVSNRTIYVVNLTILRIAKYFCGSANIPLHAKIYLLAIQAAPHLFIHIKLVSSAPYGDGLTLSYILLI